MIIYLTSDEFIEFMKRKGTKAICFQFMSLGEEYRDIPATPILRINEIFRLLHRHIHYVCFPRIDLFNDDKTLLPALDLLQRLGYKIVVTLE